MPRRSFLPKLRRSSAAPSVRRGQLSPFHATHAEPQFRLAIDPQVAQRFNAYAMAAFPREIGGLLRIVSDGDGGFRAVDLKIFPHTVANGSYFQLDGEDISRFMLDLVRSGRKSEVAEWKSLIHSHPGFAPWPSGTDRDNVQLLAGDGFAFSVICSAYRDPQRNYYLCHYAQSGQAPLLVVGIDPDNDPSELSGTDSLDVGEIEAIAAEVIEVLPAEIAIITDKRSFSPTPRDSDWPVWSEGEDWQLPEPFAEDALFDDLHEH